MQFPVNIELHLSYLISLLVALFHVIAALCAIALPYEPMLRILMLVPIILSACYVLRARRTTGFHLNGRNTIDCQLNDGGRISALVQADIAVFAQLIVLRLGDESQATSLVSFPQICPTGNFAYSASG